MFSKFGLNIYNLPPTDPAFNYPDPYVRITAVNTDGERTTKETSVKSGISDADTAYFYELIDFGMMIKLRFQRNTCRQLL